MLSGSKGGAPATVMTPDRVVRLLRLAASDRTLKEAAEIEGIRKSTLCMWAKRNRVVFADGRPEANRKRPHVSTPATVAASRANALKGSLASAERRRRLPLSPEERQAYDRYRKKAHEHGVAVSRADRLRAIGREDLAK